MSKKDFQNGFALGLASGGVVEIEKDEQEKVVDITENGTTEVTPDEGMALSKVTVNVEVASGGIEEIITITTAITNTLEAYNTFGAFMNEGENIAVFTNTKKLDEITADSYGVYAVIGAGEKAAFYRNQAANTIINIINANYDFRVSAGDTYKKVVLF